jgi:hypothetical protein
MPPKTSVMRNMMVTIAVPLDGQDSENVGRGVVSWLSDASIPARSPLRSSSSTLSTPTDDLEREWGSMVDDMVFLGTGRAGGGLWLETS